MSYPFPDDIEVEIGECTGEYAHEKFPHSEYAIDFILPKGTKILAAREGTVYETKSDSDEWGLGMKFIDKANYVVIEHDDGTYAEYLHLEKSRVDVKEGDEVITGQLLGYSGLSGCMSEPHLHFNVYEIRDKKPFSIPVEFTERNPK